MEEPIPHYGIVSFTTSNQDDKDQWFTLEVQLHTMVFKIRVSPSKFHNSPARLEEFQRYLAVLRLDTDDDKDYDPLQEADCFDWAVGPCLAEFQRLSPAPPAPKDGQLTLSHFLPNAFFKCNLTAADEVLAHQGLKPLEMGEDLWPLRYPELKEPWTTSFSSFRPAEVSVICDNPEHSFDPAYHPKNVRIGQQLLTFKEAMDLGDNITKKEVETYERIEAAGFGPSVRVSRLYGIVQNERNQLVGVLLYPIEKETSLRYVVGSKTTDAQKNRWAQQIRDTLAALHGVGIVWGAAHPHDILIDVHGDAWITNFMGGRIEGWVDADKEGTVDGDLQGLERILVFIAAGGDGLMEGLQIEE